MPLDVKRNWNACGRAFDRFNSTRDSFSEIIERPAVARLIGDIFGERALDLGCGAGPYSIWFAERGARVSGLDLSDTMISLALHKASERGLQVDLRVADIRNPLPFPASEFDLVFSATTLHYVEDLQSLFREVARILKPGGRFIASVLHPMSTAYFTLASAPEQEGPNYFGPAARSIETPWLEYGDVPDEGRRLVCHHHTTAEYFGSLIAAGFRLAELCEPEPPASFADVNPSRYEEAMRVPIYLIFQAQPARAT